MNNHITMSTDWHFGKSNGKFDRIVLEGIKQQCDHAKKHNITTMLNLGDTLDVKQTITTTTLNNLAKAVSLVSATFNDVYILVGNHDMSKKTYDASGHNLHILKGYPNVHVVDAPTVYTLLGKDFYFLPYFPNEYLKDHQFPTADYMCGHLEVKGFMLNQFVSADEGINATTVTSNFDHVFLGHFHTRQMKGNISYIGNICRFFYGEDDDPRGWTVLDVETGDIEFVEYSHPCMYKFKASTLLGDDELSNKFKAGDNLKLVIDVTLKYSELDALKSTLMLQHKLNDLVLDDQYFGWDIDDEEEEEEDETSGNTISSQDQSFMEFVYAETIKMHKIDTTINHHDAIKFLNELSKD